MDDPVNTFDESSTPQVETKTGDYVKLNHSGLVAHSLIARGLNVPENLKFCFEDYLLSVLEEVDVFKGVKVLNLGSTGLKGAGFEPLESCRALEELYLEQNHIASLASLPHLPDLKILSVEYNELNSLSMASQPRLQKLIANNNNISTLEGFPHLPVLEILSLAGNQLHSLSMASQPRLQELEANNNNISTLEGFPHLPVLEHLQVEKNPILSIPQLEVAIILLVGPSLKKLNKRDLSKDEEDVAELYPAHTASCIRDGWKFCRQELAADSIFRFLSNRWKDSFPPGYQLKMASVDKPYEGDACYSDIVFVQDRSLSVVQQLVLKYQWHIGERTLLDFVVIPDATEKDYWPKHEQIGKVLKVVCTPILGEKEYNSVFAISSPVAAGNRIPKVLSLEVCGELVEGNTIKGHAKVAWCGGTPGKGVASWHRIRRYSSSVVIVGAEDEEYQLTKDDNYSRLVFEYTPVTKEGDKGEPHYQYTDIVKAASLPSVGMSASPSVGVWNYFWGSKLWNYFRGSKQGNTDSRYSENV